MHVALFALQFLINQSSMDSLPSLRALKTVKIRREEQNLGFPERNDEDGQPLSPVASLFHQPGSNVYIVAILGSKIKLQPDVIKPLLIHALLKHPRFSSLQVRISTFTTELV